MPVLGVAEQARHPHGGMSEPVQDEKGVHVENRPGTRSQRLNEVRRASQVLTHSRVSAEKWSREGQSEP